MHLTTNFINTCVMYNILDKITRALAFSHFCTEWDETWLERVSAQSRSIIAATSTYTILVEALPHDVRMSFLSQNSIANIWLV